MLGIIHRRNGPALPVEGLSLSAARTAYATIRGHGQGGMPRFITDKFGIELIKGYRILVRAVSLGVRTRQILISVGMAMNTPYCRVGEAGINRHIIPEGLENIKYFG